jgi:hypothetical protein
MELQNTEEPKLDIALAKHKALKCVNIYIRIWGNENRIKIEEIRDICSGEEQKRLLTSLCAHDEIAAPARVWERGL